MWWNATDQAIWENCGHPCAHPLSRFTDLETEELVWCASLYHAGPLRGLKGLQKSRAVQQQRGWFSLWRREPGGWIDLLTGTTVSAAEPDQGQVALARILPDEAGWQLHFPSPERLSPMEAEPLLRRLREAGIDPKGPGSIETVEVWLQRRALCLEARETYEVRLVPKPRASLAGLLERLESAPRQQGTALVFELQLAPHEYVDDDPLVQLAESLGEVDSDWKCVAPPALQTPPVVDDLRIHSKDFILRFPATLTFQSLHKALSCFYGIPLNGEAGEFQLSLHRMVTSEEELYWNEACQRLADTQRVGKHVQPGSFLMWNEVRLHVLETTREDGPSPWFQNAPAAANQRLRRAFHSRLRKVILYPQPAPPGASRLPGLDQRNLAPLKTKEAVVACLIEAARPLTLDEVAQYLQMENFPLPHGVASLKKAWRRDPVVREDSQGRVQLVAGAVLLDNGLMQRLSPLYGGEELLSRRLEELFGLNTVPALAHLHPEHEYGSLHGYILEQGKRKPVDWRAADQPDLWEKLYHAKGKAEVKVQVRAQEPWILHKPWIARSGNRPDQLLFCAGSKWWSTSLDDLLDVEVRLPAE